MQADEDRDKTQLISDLAEMRQQLSKAEEALQVCTARLKQSQEEFKTFAYIVSHDLRNPLINLKGFAAELGYAVEAVRPALDVALPLLDEEQKQKVTRAFEEDIPESLEFIVFSVGRIDEFMNAVLKLSRLGRRPLKLETIDMEALVQDVLASLAASIEQSHVQVTVNPLPKVLADRAALEEIMANLLKNAVLYVDPERPGKVEVSAAPCPGHVLFHVRDNGRGISEEDKHKVFEPFRRAGKQDVAGEGMGLAYVQALVRRLGGHISFESEFGIGTTFTFSISDALEEGGSEHAF